MKNYLFNNIIMRLFWHNIRDYAIEQNRIVLRELVNQRLRYTVLEEESKMNFDLWLGSEKSILENIKARMN